MRRRMIAVLLTLVIALLGVPSAALGESGKGLDLQQPAVETRVKDIIEVDGYQFRDLNDNGELDVYEDWREDTEDRITDLLSQMTLEEKVGLLFHIDAFGLPASPYPVTDEYLYSTENPFGESSGNGLYSMYYYINDCNLTHFLYNTQGTPVEIATNINKMQAIAEETRLGVPLTFSCDRRYNFWGGMIDAPHKALASANDLELSSKLWEIYAEEMRAIGYQVVLQSYGVELLSGFYGEIPTKVAEIVDAEVEATTAGGVYNCIKHFIARGGTSFGEARSAAQLYENWMVPWAAAIDAGAQWIMTNSGGTGLSNDVGVEYDKATMSYLRDTLGYEGVVLTDWGVVGIGTTKVSGVTVDGIDLSTFDYDDLYIMMLENGVDQFGSNKVYNDYTPFTNPGPGGAFPGYPLALIDAVESGKCDISLIETAARRILRTKFDMGLFENPYSDIDAALAIGCSDEYIAEPWEIVDTATLNAARNPEVVALERELMYKSATLVKNENSMLPLQAGVKLYVTGTEEAIYSADAEALAEYTEVVDSMEEADVVVARLSSLEDDAWLLVEDTLAAGKQLVIMLDGVEPETYFVENADAMVYMTYDAAIDHGTATRGFYRTTLPDVYAEMLFGELEPQGLLLQEVVRSDEQAAEDWGDLANDAGADTWTRMLMAQMVKENPEVELPINYGDPLYTYGFSMHYGETGEFAYDTLVLPTALDDMGNSAIATQKSGEPFTIYFIVNNLGEDDIVTVEVMDGESIVGSKLMAVNGGDWRICKMDITLEGAGEHVLAVGGLSASVTVE